MYICIWWCNGPKLHLKYVLVICACLPSCNKLVFFFPFWLVVKVSKINLIHIHYLWYCCLPLVTGCAISFSNYRSWITTGRAYSHSMDHFQWHNFFSQLQRVWQDKWSWNSQWPKHLCWFTFSWSRKWKFRQFQSLQENKKYKNSYGHKAFYKTSLWFAGIMYGNHLCLTSALYSVF